MNEPDGSSTTDSDLHTSAAMAFVRRVSERDVRPLESLILFGSTARNEATGLESDIDFLAIVSDDADKRAVEDELRDIAYDVMLEHGPVVEVHVLSHSTFDQRRDDPFIRRVVRDGEVYV
jgi:predicted nucleotidyltransferase